MGKKEDLHTQSRYSFKINRISDYQSFFEKYVNYGTLAAELKGQKIFFEIILNANGRKKADELLFFYYFLINEKYGNDADFSAIVDIDCPVSVFKKDPDFFRLNTFFYLFLQRPLDTHIWIRSSVEYKVGKDGRDHIMTPWPKKELNQVGNLMPVMGVDERLLKLLQTPVTEVQWTKISNEKLTKPDSADATSLDSPEKALLHLCNRFLFQPIGNCQVLSELRKVAFSHPDFSTALFGLPLLALVVFSLFDYQYRMDMLEQYKAAIKLYTGNRRVTFKLEDFLEEQQYRQDGKRYQAHQALAETGIDNKTLLVISDRKMLSDTDKTEDIMKKIALHPEAYILHSNLISELYEATSIAEGLLQLLENVVFHAGTESRSGTGLLAIHIHRCELRPIQNSADHSQDDTADLKEHFPDYMEIQLGDEVGVDKKLHGKPRTKYFLEIMLADLSDSDIASKFKHNHRAYLSGADAAKYKAQFDNFDLKSFFAPNEEENKAWDHFYQESSHIINHYGLQIFNSIVSSKNGFFYVNSHKTHFCSLHDTTKQDSPYLPEINGTSYAILLPMKSKSSADKNIYDSMFSYDLKSAISKPHPAIYHYSLPKIPSFSQFEEKESFINLVADALFIHANPDTVIVVDISQTSSVECLIKGMVSSFYRMAKETGNSPQIRYALLNCTAAEIVNIVRLISLFYNRQAKSDVMRNVQIYIRGKRIGEEVLFYGASLQEVEHNIAKIACMRGILYENYKTIHDIFKR